ncbi:protein of unknown function [Bacillus sp. OV166]|uniref:DUF4275 family protein n=1 Tax=Bacillus sp. OV166 TaxID=1882763 RepID=UPI000A2AD432|nr:DUF4275 family protein [Bacillus sp. OV166]SMQ81562.1 protein of unknown function [Bacillus sp. OV166]
MQQIDLLKEKGILVTELKNKRNELRKQWEEAFAKHLSKSQKRKIFFHQHLWHVFSFNKLPCVEGLEAGDAFDKKKKDACYIFYQDNDYVLLLENAIWLKAEDKINEIDGYINDVYVVDKDFSWTFIHTHEYFCGLYFFQQVQE